jgi:hypothetical protein
MPTKLLHVKQWILPRSSSRICGPFDAPPYTHVWRTFELVENRVATSATCCASSRVGTRTKHCIVNTFCYSATTHNYAALQSSNISILRPAEVTSNYWKKTKQCDTMQHIPQY